MLDMGFYDDIMRIATQLPSERQTLLFSATMPPRIRKLAKDILRNPAEVKIAPSRPVEKIVQSAVMCGDNQKESILRRLLKERHGSKVIVFASSKLGVRDLTRSLRRAGIKAAEIHSDLGQKERDDTIHDFRAERLDVLVATDLLARGIDIDDISMVVNYDVPREPEDYVHRIGRTGRANAEGMAVTIVSPRDRRAFSRVESTLKIKIPLEDLIPGADTGRSDRNSGDRRQNKERNTHRRGQKGKDGRNKPSPDTIGDTPNGQPAISDQTTGNNGADNKKKPRNRRYKPRRRPSDGNNRRSKDA